jgi:hypothetical protein
VNYMICEKTIYIDGSRLQEYDILNLSYYRRIGRKLRIINVNPDLEKDMQQHITRHYDQKSMSSAIDVFLSMDCKDKAIYLLCHVLYNYEHVDDSMFSQVNVDDILPS